MDCEFFASSFYTNPQRSKENASKILTIDWTPNNEIVINNINGWLIESHLDKVYETIAKSWGTATNIPHTAIYSTHVG